MSTTPPQCWDPILLEALQVRCMLPQSLCVHLYISLVMSGEHCFLGGLHFLWLLQSFCSLFNIVPGDLGEDLVKTFLYDRVLPILYNSAHCPAVGLHGDFHLL